MFVWSSSASPVSKGNPKHSVNRASSNDFIVTDASKPENAASKAMNELIENMSPGRQVKEVDTNEELKFQANVVDIEEERSKKARMPPASVMTRLILVMVWRKLIRNPNTYSSLLGLIWSLISFRWNIGMPKIVNGSISIISNGGLGMAMFSLGLFMALQPKIIAGGKLMAVYSMAVRFLAAPAVTAATSVAVGIRGDLLRVAIVQAALPQGIVPFVFAKEYNVHAEILGTAVIFGMLVAFPVTIVYYILLGL